MPSAFLFGFSLGTAPAQQAAPYRGGGRASAMAGGALPRSLHLKPFPVDLDPCHGLGVEDVVAVNTQGHLSGIFVLAAIGTLVKFPVPAVGQLGAVGAEQLYAGLHIVSRGLAQRQTAVIHADDADRQRFNTNLLNVKRCVGILLGFFVGHIIMEPVSTLQRDGFLYV